MKSPLKCLLIICILLCGTAILSNSMAQDTPVPKASATSVAVCDVVHVFNYYKRAGDLTTQLKNARQVLSAENDRRGKAIEALGMELESLIEDSNEYKKRSEQMLKLNVDRKAWLEFEETKAMHEHLRLTREMYTQILDMVQNIAQERGVQVVLYKDTQALEIATNTPELLSLIERRKVLYSDDSLDITDDVLSRLNAAYTASLK